MSDVKNPMDEAAAKMQGTTKKVKSKEAIDKKVSFTPDAFGGLQIPAHIQKELKEANLTARFVSIKVLNERGGFHPRGWIPYVVKNPIENPLTGQSEKTYRIGDLVLAVKSATDAKAHKDYLQGRADSQVAAQGESIKQMRDKIREGRADKHISLLEGYEENDDDSE